jgi:mycofactocin system creatininase family protein
VSTDLADLGWPDLAGRAPDLLLLVPVGATEQHGPHLPLSTDTEIATAIADELARRRPGTIVAPAVAYGSSGEHAGFAGTISIGSEATETLLIELVRSASISFQRIVLICTHGGNAETVARVVMHATEEGHDLLAWSPRWHADAHAGRTETSLMLAIRPQAVRLERARAGNTAPLEELLPALRAHGVAAVSDNGVLGDPAGASAAEGTAMFADLLADLNGYLESWPDGRP